MPAATTPRTEYPGVSVTASSHPAAHAADVVPDHVLPVVGALFALYLLAVAALYLVTAFFKATAGHGAHHPLVRHRVVELPDGTTPTTTPTAATTGAPS